MEEKEILVSPESTYEDLKELTKKLQDMFSKHVAPGVLGSCPIRTHDSNRPAITGLAQGNTTVISNDMRTAGALYSEIVHLLCANDVRTSDWRINQELGLKPWEG